MAENESGGSSRGRSTLFWIIVGAAVLVLGVVILLTAPSCLSGRRQPEPIGGSAPQAEEPTSDPVVEAMQEMSSQFQKQNENLTELMQSLQQNDADQEDIDALVEKALEKYEAERQPEATPFMINIENARLVFEMLKNEGKVVTSGALYGSAWDKEGAVIEFEMPEGYAFLETSADPGIITIDDEYTFDTRPGTSLGGKDGKGFLAIVYGAKTVRISSVGFSSINEHQNVSSVAYPDLANGQDEEQVLLDVAAAMWHEEKKPYLYVLNAITGEEWRLRSSSHQDASVQDIRDAITAFDVPLEDSSGPAGSDVDEDNSS